MTTTTKNETQSRLSLENKKTTLCGCINNINPRYIIFEWKNFKDRKQFKPKHKKTNR